MKKLLSIFLVVTLISLPFLSMAQGASGKNDAEAKKILDAVSAKFKAFKTVQAKFSLKIENGSGKSLGSKSGSVSMKGTKYLIKINGQDIYSDGSAVWSYDKSSNEVTVNKIDPSSNSITPQKLFTNFYDKDFLYKLNGDVKEGGKTLKEIELTPIDKTRPFHKVLIYVENATIYTTKIFEKTGTRFTYSINNIKTDASITDASFVFDEKKYPGVEVVDLR
ncbi:MAG: outer membrane lipoprotein carrier protein LolA [Ferruginibacter sp.]|nr:outer membrane lipoprotein carrier protein LolA [Ferruginibacter sp.]